MSSAATISVQSPRFSMTVSTPAFATRSIHVGASPHAGSGARVTPIFHTNGFVFEDLDHGSDIFALKRTGFSYSRGSNPNLAALEARIASLEGGAAAVACASGQSALLIVLLALCATGDEIVSADALFGGSLTLLRRMEQRLGIRTRWADPFDPAAIEAAITAETKAILIESVVNPSGDVVDLPAIAAVAQRRGVPLVVDNTLATPALLRPIEHGADVVIHSASKHLGGSGTVIGGLIVDAGRFPWRGDARFPLMSAPWAEYDRIVPVEAFPQTAFAVACRLLGLRELGPGLSPTNAFLILTGIETLPLRMERHCRNAEAVAGYLAGHPAVSSVSLPALPDHPRHALAKRLCPLGVGSIFTMTLRGGEPAARTALQRLRLFSHLVNIGETRSLVAHPASTTHRGMSPSDRRRLGIEDGTLRLSVGIENEEDLLFDLEQALAEA